MSEERFDRLEQMVANLVGMVGSLNTQMVEMRQDLAQTNATVAKLSEEVARNTAELAKLNGEVSELKGQVSELQEQVSKLNGEVSELKGQVKKLNGEVSELQGQVAKLNEDMAVTKQAVLENANRLDRVEVRLDRIEHHVQHQGERFQEFDKRLVNVEHGMYRVSCVERAQNKMIVHLHEVDVELSLVKDKLPATLEPRELEKVSS